MRIKSGLNAFRGLTKYLSSIPTCGHYSSSIISSRCEKTVTETHKSDEICKFNSWIKESRCLASLYTILNTTKMLFKLISFHVLWWMGEKSRKFSFFLHCTNRAFRKIITPKRLYPRFFHLFPLPHKIISKTICTWSKITCCLALSFCHLNLSLRQSSKLL